MNHEQMRDEVMAFFDGELRGERKATAESHIRECRECRTLEAAWIKTSSLLRTESPATSDRFVSAVMARIDRAEERQSGWFSFAFPRWLAPVAAGLAFAGYVALLVLPASEAPTATETVLYSEVEDQLPATLAAPAGASQDHIIDVAPEEI